jgi:hypothetical protein
MTLPSLDRAPDEWEALSTRLRECPPSDLAPPLGRSDVVLRVRIQKPLRSQLAGTARLRPRPLQRLRARMYSWLCQ